MTSLDTCVGRFNILDDYELNRNKECEFESN